MFSLRSRRAVVSNAVTHGIEQDMKQLVKPSILLRNQLGAQSQPDQAGYIEDIQPLHQLGTMILDRFRADFQNQGDRLGGLAFGDQLKDLTLPSRQLFERTFCLGYLLRWKLFQQAG